MARFKQKPPAGARAAMDAALEGWYLLREPDRELLVEQMRPQIVTQLCTGAGATTEQAKYALLQITIAVCQAEIDSLEGAG